MASPTRRESNFSNEPDPWENEVPISFQSIRRESHAKPPPHLHIPRAITLPNLLPRLSPIRNRNSNDDNQEPFSPGLLQVPPKSPRSVRFSRPRVVDDHNAIIEDVSPATKSRPPTIPSTKSRASPSQAPRSLIWRTKLRHSTGSQRYRTDEGWADASKSNRKEPEQATNVDLKDVPPLSPVSENTEDGEGRSSRWNWLRGRVRHVLRIKRRERE